MFRQHRPEWQELTNGLSLRFDPGNTNSPSIAGDQRDSTTGVRNDEQKPNHYSAERWPSINSIADAIRCESNKLSSTSLKKYGNRRLQMSGTPAYPLQLAVHSVKPFAAVEQPPQRSETIHGVLHILGTFQSTSQSVRTNSPLPDYFRPFDAHHIHTLRHRDDYRCA
jgi:hypothetical protein